jgi:hypothetical protein
VLGAAGGYVGNTTITSGGTFSSISGLDLGNGLSWDISSLYSNGSLTVTAVPKPEQYDNLLVPIALSCTHVGISSLRIEGTWMIIGQSAGVAAALAAKQDVAVQELDYKKLREQLIVQKQVLELPEAPEVSSLPSSDASVPTR